LQALSRLQGFKRQFWELKRTHMDVVLFVQVGNFYNLWVSSPTAVPIPRRGISVGRLSRHVGDTHHLSSVDPNWL
jgi:hypothetical protein